MTLSGLSRRIRGSKCKVACGVRLWEVVAAAEITARTSEAALVVLLQVLLCRKSSFKFNLLAQWDYELKSAPRQDLCVTLIDYSSTDYLHLSLKPVPARSPW